MATVLKKFSHGMRRWLAGDEVSPGALGNRPLFDQLVKTGYIGDAKADTKPAAKPPASEAEAAPAA